MRHTDGADIRAALRFWREAGYSIRDLADSLNINPSTAYRWVNGTYRPNVSNFEALKSEIDMRYATENARHNLTVVGAQLASAYAALETDVDRARAEALAARMTADFAAREDRREAEQAERNANARAIRDEVLGQRKPNSVTYQVDPFALIDSGRPREEAMFS